MPQKPLRVITLVLKDEQASTVTIKLKCGHTLVYRTHPDSLQQIYTYYSKRLYKRLACPQCEKEGKQP